MIELFCGANIASLIPVSILPVLLVFAALGGSYYLITLFLPAAVEKTMNTVRNPPPYHVTPEAQELHRRLMIADLHADPLMWKRDLLRYNRVGHVDVPRMLAGNIGFQVFGVVTKSPRGMNFEQNSAQTFDNITLVAVASGWPLCTWRSLLQRALYQAGKLRRFARRSEGKLMLVRSQQELQAFLDLRRAGRKVVGGFASLEGVHALEGKLENLDLLYRAGFRMIGLTHFFDNEAGGSAHGLAKGGLTDFGRSVIQKTQELHMVVDLAHSSPRIIDEALAMTRAPLVVSHTGVRGTCDNVRNMSDEHVRGIARTGGVIGIAMFDQAVCETSVDATVRAMRYSADLVGVEHVALGCDFDGTIDAPMDYSGMALLTESLLKHGFNQAEIALMLGMNFMRVLKEILPE